MCGRTTLTITPDDLQRAFGFEVPPEYRPRYNIAPSQSVLTVAAAGGAPGFRYYRWGLVPFWAKDRGIGSRLINARGEGIASKPAFRAAFGRRRCLVVVDGFCEWCARPGGKQPYRICLRGRGPFTLAGIWERWERNGEVLESCAIITTAANETMKPIHDRMPVIVAPGDRDRWIDGDTESGAVQALLRPYEGDDLDAYEVSTLVNNPGNDVPECLDPLPGLEIG